MKIVIDFEVWKTWSYFGIFDLSRSDAYLHWKTTRGFSFRTSETRRYFLFLALLRRSPKKGRGIIDFVPREAIDSRILFKGFFTRRIVSHRVYPLDLNPKPYPQLLPFIFQRRFPKFRASAEETPFLLSDLSVSKPLREVLIGETAGGIPLEEEGCGRLYLNWWRATMYDWDAWKCHGTCLTSGSTLQLQSRRKGILLLRCSLSLSSWIRIYNAFRKIESAKILSSDEYFFLFLSFF